MPGTLVSDRPALLSAAQRANPRYLSGDELKAHAHRQGMGRSALAGMSDEKIREQLRYITQNKHEQPD